MPIAKRVSNAWLPPAFPVARPPPPPLSSRRVTNPTPTSAQNDEALYQERASRELVSLLDALDELGDELEVELASDILTIEFKDGARFVLNSHRAARQLWMAALMSAWHFDYDEQSSQWLCSRSGGELWSILSKQVSEQLNRPVTLTPSA